MWATSEKRCQTGFLQKESKKILFKVTVHTQRSASDLRERRGKLKGLGLRFFMESFGLELVKGMTYVGLCLKNRVV